MSNLSDAQVTLLLNEKKFLQEQLTQQEQSLKKKETLFNEQKKILEEEKATLIKQVKCLTSEKDQLWDQIAEKEREFKQKEALLQEEISALKKRVEKLTNVSQKKLILENEDLTNQVAALKKELEKNSNELNREKTASSTKIKRLEQELKTIQEEHQRKIEEATKSHEQTISDLNKRLKEFGFEEVSEGKGNKKPDSDFYAGIIDIPSMKRLLKGWDIMIKNWEEYQKLVQTPGTIVSVIGNYSKGKTFLLELLTGNHLPKGFNVNTQGISILYLKDEAGKQRPIIALDTKGGGNPLDILPEGDLIDGNGDKPASEADILTEKLRDRGATEDLLQNFILDQASIILVVVSDLTFDDQKLVNKITRKFKANPSKKIIVVHNLFHTHYVEDAQQKIENSILHSFNLNKAEFRDPISEKNSTYFVDSLKTIIIPHVILCKQHTKAGDYFNEPTVRYLKDNINSNDANQSVDIVKTFHNYLQENLQDYIQANRKLEKEDLVLNKVENYKPVGLLLKNIQSFQMKEAYTDVFGDLQIFKDGFQPSYTLFREVRDQDEAYLCLMFECPDGCTGVQTKIRHQFETFFIQVRGKKEQTYKKNDVIINNRQFGEFSIQTGELNKSLYHLYYDAEPQKEYSNGLFIIRWKLKPEAEEDWQ